jgi:hypothetical protein
VAGKNSSSVLLAELEPGALAIVREVGIMELNRNPENYFAGVEQAAFEPSNIVPWISFSPDKMLQFRIFAYASLKQEYAVRACGKYHGDGRKRKERKKRDKTKNFNLGSHVGRDLVADGIQAGARGQLS